MKKTIVALITIVMLTSCSVNVFSMTHSSSENNNLLPLHGCPTQTCGTYSPKVDLGSEIDDIGWFTSLALDTHDTPHISYYDYTNGDLKYATLNGETWEIQTVDSTGDVGRYTSIVLDETETPHISYYDYTNEDLKYASYGGTGWITVTVDSWGNVGLYTSLDLDSMNRPHISYCDYTHRALKYAFFTGTTWKKTVVDDSAVICADNYFCDYTSLDLDAYDMPHISYCDYEHGDLKYANLLEDLWQIEVVDSSGDVGVYSSLIIDMTGKPHISYADFTYPQFDLKYATKSDDGWITEYVDQAGDVRKWTSLSLDGDQNPHISYYDYTNGSLEYTYYKNNQWYKETVETNGSTGCFNSLYLRTDSAPYISFYDWGNKALKVSSKNGDLWRTEIIEIDTNSDFIDQKQVYCSGYASGILSSKPFAESFVPSYSVLTRIELMLIKRFNPGDFTLSIRENLNGEDLVSIHMVSSAIPEDISWKHFDFIDLCVQPGRTYYIVCTPEYTEDYNMYYWYFGHNNPYSSGDAWVFDHDDWEVMRLSAFPQLDFGFKTFGLNTTIPEIPTITGPTAGSTGVEYEYQVYANDLDDDELWYKIEWGPDDVETIGPFPAGETMEVGHTWAKRGEYIISVKAIDTHGAESGWGILEVSMPKIHRYQTVREIILHFVESYLCNQTRVFLNA